MQFAATKYLLLLALMISTLVVNAQPVAHPVNNEVFLQDEVAEVHITIDPNDLNTLLGDSLYSDFHFPAVFSYHTTTLSDTINEVGFRVRGNTSRDAGKKSFKVSFNEYIIGQKFYGIEKMNLVGQHNDPSLLRYWLSLKTLRDNGLISSRVSFVKLYINTEYRGLYLNVEHIDDEFLQKRFLFDDQGNLYKCHWGANLKYWGNNPVTYAGSYELKTNKLENDYSGLMNFLDTLNNISDEEFPCFIERSFDVEFYLKTYAAEILIGHWDGYAMNNNNFYLYQRASNRKFVFIEYDMDNTFGIDWFNIDWSTRHVNYWQSSNRPLIERLLSVPYYKDQFNAYLEEVLNYLNATDWYGALRQKQADLSAAVQTDTYYNMDYGFQYYHFLNALDSDFGAHVKQGIAEYLNQRIDSAMNQLEFDGNEEHPCPPPPSVEEENETKEVIKIVDLLGRETKFQPNIPLIYIYSDGTTERVLKFE